MAIKRGFYKRYYGTESEITNINTNILRETEKYYCTDTLKEYIFLNGIWNKISNTVISGGLPGGSDGTDGTSGTSGTSGNAGKSGDVGESGTSGTSGTTPAVTLNKDIWYDLSGTYASTSSFTYTCQDSANSDIDGNNIISSLFCATDSTKTTRKFGYVKSISRTTTTMTVTVVTNSNLANTDTIFMITPQIKINQFYQFITIPGEIIADASYPQGMFYSNIKTNSYLLPVDASVITAATGTSCACTFNIYAGTTGLFGTAPDLGTNGLLVEQKPTTYSINANSNISLRITSSTGSTTKAQDFQARLMIIPQHIFNAF